MLINVLYWCSCKARIEDEYTNSSAIWNRFRVIGDRRGTRCGKSK